MSKVVGDASGARCVVADDAGFMHVLGSSNAGVIKSNPRQDRHKNVGAVAVVRVSGPDVPLLFQTILRCDIKARHVHVGGF